jgi:hypothetical protein
VLSEVRVKKIALPYGIFKIDSENSHKWLSHLDPSRSRVKLDVDRMSQSEV